MSLYQPEKYTKEDHDYAIYLFFLGVAYAGVALFGIITGIILAITDHIALSVFAYLLSLAAIYLADKYTQEAVKLDREYHDGDH